MKKQAILICLAASLLLGFQPVQKSPDLGSFIQYVSSNYQLPKSVKEDCKWNYAIVKVFTDRNDKINSYEVLNYASQDTKDSFKYLIGYKFTPRLHLHQRPIVFCFTVDNRKQDCAVDQFAHSPTEVMGRVLSMLGEQHEKYPGTIIEYTLIIKSIYDTIR